MVQIMNQQKKYFLDLTKKYFDGKTPIEAIIYYENIYIDVLDVYFRVFEDYLFRVEHEDQFVERINQKYNFKASC